MGDRPLVGSGVDELLIFKNHPQSKPKKQNKPPATLGINAGWGGMYFSGAAGIGAGIGLGLGSSE